MSDATHPRFGSDEYRALGSLAVTLLVMAVLLFLPAGTLEWPRAWWYLAIFVAAILVAIVYIWRVDPELFAIRRKPQAGGKSWDLAFVAVTLTSMAAILPVAGLDYRFGWSQLPDGVVWLGYVIFAAGFCLTAWAQGVNRHFELTVRIQTDRGHKVIDAGPYATIRHPGYIGGVALGIGTALALASLVAVIPAAICAVALALRTLAEEATLSEELEGYSGYMQRVRFRWIPGVW
ncbi:isoprenylcysteine carboxylmethyltransferase family protein [Devosia sp. LjRoot16]|uniref:methyltransferase family protein n=1 Tax=Devosia sp. LjRoot16 TaxID=3342271 RepID=UPI003ECE9A02